VAKKQAIPQENIKQDPESTNEKQTKIEKWDRFTTNFMNK
jgi:hypothetical protein